MKRFSVLGLWVGLALLTILITWQGWARTTDVLHVVGWQLFWLPTYFLLPLGCALFSWWYLFPSTSQPRLMLSAYCIWINFAVNWLLPVAQVGGELARIRLLLKRKFPNGEAIASVVGDQTLQIISQALYALMGIILLAVTQSRVSEAKIQGLQGQSLPFFFLVGSSLVILTVISAGIYWLQHQGLFQMFSKIAHKFPAFDQGMLSAQATTLDEAIMAMYQRRDRLLIATLWRVGFRIFAAGETWLALKFLGHPVGAVDALILESLGQAIRSAAFLLPGGLGAQEGGIMAIGAVLGLPINVGLSLSLCKRIRELAIGVPGLIALQLEEGKGLFP